MIMTYIEVMKVKIYCIKGSTDFSRRRTNTHSGYGVTLAVVPTFQERA